MAMTLLEIKQALGITRSSASDQVTLRYLYTDSRQVSFGQESLFVALVTLRRDGHQFLEDAYQKGVRFFLVSAPPAEAQFPGAEWLEVPDTLAALQAIAGAHRRKFTLPVIGITGSNGKTIVKEWLYQLLWPTMHICRSPRSYNSQIGVPLSVWNLHTSHELAIFEAGISRLGEMEKLASIIQPIIGLFTNLGAAHDEGFANRQEKLQEKWKLFDTCHTVICNTDQELVPLMATSSGKNILSWGKNDRANYRVEAIRNEGTHTEIDLKWADGQYTFSLPLVDEASIENGIHCIVTCLFLGMAAPTIDERLKGLHALQMRLEWKKGVHNSLLLNDSYSHDINSLEIALNHLVQQSGANRRMAILSDLPQISDAKVYAQLALLLRQKEVRTLVGIGPEIKVSEDAFKTMGIETSWFPSTTDFLENFNKRTVENAVVLIKGARAFGFEKIAATLQLQQHETLLEINLGALAQNLNVFRSQLKPPARLMVMLKAFGYGSTDAELGRWLQHHGADYLAVAYTDEGVALREAGVSLPVMVMNPEPGTFEQILDYSLEPEIYSFNTLRSFSNFLAQQGVNSYPVHVKLDTGMHRLGFLPGELPELLSTLSDQTCPLRLKSVFTHLVASEDPDCDEFTRQQGDIFLACAQQLEWGLGYSFLKHVSNTAAIIRHPTLHLDMVRLGIGLFGISTANNEKPNLVPATRLLTTVAQVKKVAAGETIGYGRKARVQRDSLIATVRVGYADGYRRQLGNGVGQMWVKGARATVVGNVCMDMTMLDVTDIKEVQEGDEVEVFGPHVAVAEIAERVGTIPYEILTGISRRVKRVLVDE